MTRHVERQELLKFHFPSNPSFSPGGGHVAFRVSRPDVEKNGYAPNLWSRDLKSGTSRRMTFSGAEKFFRWSADGAFLIFAMEVMRSRLYELNGNERPLQIAFRASTVVDYRNPRGGDGRGEAP